MEQLASQIASAANMRALYPSKHPQVVESVEKIARALQQVLERTKEGSITYLLVGEDLVVGDDVIRKTTLSVREFVGMMKSRGIERLTLAAGMNLDEAHQFIGALVEGRPMQSSAHIIVGRAHIVMEDKPKETERRTLSVEQLEIVRDSWAKFRVERRLPVEHLEELVWSFIDSLANTTRAILPLAALKSHDEYTFVHSVNVSLLVIAQARSFGISGPMLHSFGMAALLHDIGKLFVPIEILHKPGALSGHEWEVMKSHPKEGAWHLSQMANIQPLAVIVAFEHHLRYDGHTNYPVLRSSRMPNLASRMTAIAGSYDAMLTVRPYQQPIGRDAAFDLLRRRAGTFYDPMLVGNFVRLIGGST